MAITKITDPGAVPTTVADYEAQNELIKTALTGLAKITLSNYDNDSAPAVKVGSIIDVGGTTYIVSTGDETPTGYSGISASTTFYLYYDESAGVFIYSSTVPVWNDVYQGWYNGDDRAFFSMYKDSGGTLYQSKSILVKTHILKTKIIELGAWDMDTYSTIYVPHGVADYSKIRTWQVIITGDDGSGREDMLYDLIAGHLTSPININGGCSLWVNDKSKLRIVRAASEDFDSADYSSTAQNRGWLTISYVD